MTITPDQIFAAADELDAAGHNSTLAAVRKALGAGSFTTISQAMGEWRARRASADTAPKEPALALITERLAGLGAELWLQAQVLAHARLTAEREALDGARRRMEAGKAEAAELTDQLVAELEAAKARMAALAAAERVAHAEADALQARLAQANERAATAEARSDEAGKRADEHAAELAQVNRHNAELLRMLGDSIQAPQASAKKG